jgi:hypothetical protein
MFCRVDFLLLSFFRNICKMALWHSQVRQKLAKVLNFQPTFRSLINKNLNLYFSKKISDNEQLYFS